MNIILIGFKNSGKSSVGKALAAALKFNFIDTDRLIERLYQQHKSLELTVREIYQQEGEKFFRAQEKKVILSLKHDKKTVIATGGGSVLDRENVYHLKKIGMLVHLKVSFEEIVKRGGTHFAPAFANKDDTIKNLKEVFTAREALYQEIADLEIAADQPLMSIVDTICRHQLMREYRYGK
jgi:shikimate kinase